MFLLVQYLKRHGGIYSCKTTIYDQRTRNLFAEVTQLVEWQNNQFLGEITSLSCPCSHLLVNDNYIKIISFNILLQNFGIIPIWFYKGGFWILGPKDRWIKAQRARCNEFVENELKTRFQWIGQWLQWTKDIEKARKTMKNKFVKRNSSSAISKESNTWISIFLSELITITVLSATIFSPFQLSDASL